MRLKLAVLQVFLSMPPRLDPIALRMQVRLLLQYADAAVRTALDRPGPEGAAILRLAGENLGVLWQAFCETARAPSSGR
jgi:hypothetical protein